MTVAMDLCRLHIHQSCMAGQYSFVLDFLSLNSLCTSFLYEVRHNIDYIYNFFSLQADCLQRILRWWFLLMQLAKWWEKEVQILITFERCVFIPFVGLVACVHFFLGALFFLCQIYLVGKLLGWKIWIISSNLEAYT